MFVFTVPQLFCLALPGFFLIMFSDLFVDRCTYDVPLPALLNVDGRMAYAATQLGSARMGHVQMTSKIFEFETSFPCHHFSYKNLPSYGHLLSLMTLYSICMVSQAYPHSLGTSEISLCAHGKSKFKLSPRSGNGTTWAQVPNVILACTDVPVHSDHGYSDTP